MMFLPANTTTQFQPMDVGIIASFKYHCCKLITCKQLTNFEEDVTLSIDVYDVLLLVAI